MSKMNVDVFIAQHRHINYCEAIIYEDGQIEYVRPSHVMRLQDIYCEKFNMTLEELSDKMPVDAIAIKWLVDETKCIPIWYDYVCMGNLVPNPMQKDTIQRLQSAGIINIDIKEYPVW